MTTKEIVKALRCCAEGIDGCHRCLLYEKGTEACFEMDKKAADLIESLPAELEAIRHQLEQAKQERDAWKLRAEAAVRDMRGAIREPEDSCKLCAHQRTCGGKDCPKYTSGMGGTDQNGKEYPDRKWECVVFEYGTCPMLEDTPCNGCDYDNHWEWRGPCAENGGAEDEEV